MMKVAYDTQIFSAQKFGGVSRYFCSLAAELSRHALAQTRIFAPFYINAYLDSIDRGLVVGRKVNPLPKTGSIVRAASVLLSMPGLYAFKPDIVHETYYSPFPSLPGKAGHVVTVYDMIHEKFASNFSRLDPIATWKKKAISRADRVICISEQTRRDLLEFHSIPEEKVSVTYLGYDSLANLGREQNGPAFRRDLLGGDVPYLLYVGSRGGYKNFDGLLRAYASSSWLMDNFFLVCFGGGFLSPRERALLEALHVSEKIVQVGEEDSYMATCYRHAAAFVYPSLYEGFGIPPLEAMSLDCPVICSNTSSIPEVVGDAAHYFDPEDTESMRVAIEGVLQSNERRNRLVRLGQERRQMFSWQRCATETFSIYRSVTGT